MSPALTGRRKPAPPADPQTPAAQETEAIEEADWVGGWSTGAQANSAALLRWIVWGLIALGPLLGALAYLSVPATSASPAPKAAPSAPAASGGQGAAGFASLFVAAYLSAGRGDEPKLAVYYPQAASMQLDGVSGRHRGEQLTVVRLRQTDASVWAVTVAARVTGTQPSPAPSTQPGADPSQSADAVRYFQVPVATAPGAGGATAYTALALPAEVAAPERAKTPELVYGAMRPALPTDPRTQAVTSFLSAYLTKAGAELDRYLAPGTRLAAPSPAPYSGVAVDQFAVEGKTGGEPVVSVPGDGTTLRLLVTLRGTGQDGVRLPLTYALTLKARAGRWEIASLDGAPALTSPTPAASGAPGSTPTPTA
ncbi:conjugal transfer protein (plasmid) [Streptomyces sp. NBC_00513]|uniref:conjugal transfer protein n=1 Tax=unclassified Streptomyces TaxID=2593676 RepID=UPI002259BA10|nr:conjugal transfer protein [Streptomyces sp. NBC_00424]MCX5078827.1 conjugal transfer protein [Streptomyces sp. NBC_00424]WUD46253.1 conjugal transfer protein [Streptomyces sp. NBC_00513]